MKNIYYGTSNDKDFYNIFMFTVNCINQDCEIRFPIVSMISTYQNHMAHIEGFPENEFMDNVFSNAALFKYLSIQALDKLVRYTALQQRLQKVGKDFIKFEESKYYEKVYSDIIGKYRCFYSTGFELFKYLYSECKYPRLIGNMTFFIEGSYHCIVVSDETVDRDLLSFRLKECHHPEMSKMIDSLYSMNLGYFTVEKFIEVVNSYVPEFINNEYLAYIWLDTLIRYKYISSALHLHFMMLCNVEKLKLFITPEIVLDRNLFTAIINYCKDIFVVWRRMWKFV